MSTTVTIPRRCRPSDMLRHGFMEESQFTNAPSVQTGTRKQLGRKQLEHQNAVNLDATYQSLVSKTSVSYRKAHFQRESPLPFGGPLDAPLRTIPSELVSNRAAGKLLPRDIESDKPDLMAALTHDSTVPHATPASLQRASFVPHAKESYETRRQIVEAHSKSIHALREAVTSSFEIHHETPSSMSTIQRDSFKAIAPRAAGSLGHEKAAQRSNSLPLCTPAYCWESFGDGPSRYRMGTTSTSRGDFTVPELRFSAPSHPEPQAPGGMRPGLLPAQDWGRASSPELQATKADGAALDRALSAMAVTVADAAADPRRACSAFAVALKRPGVPHTTVHIPLHRRQLGCLARVNASPTKSCNGDTTRVVKSKETAAGALGFESVAERRTGKSENQSAFLPFRFVS